MHLGCAILPIIFIFPILNPLHCLRRFYFTGSPETRLRSLFPSGCPYHLKDVSSNSKLFESKGYSLGLYFANKRTETT